MLLNFFVIIITKSITQSKIWENVGQNVKKKQVNAVFKENQRTWVLELLHHNRSYTGISNIVQQISWLVYDTVEKIPYVSYLDTIS